MALLLGHFQLRTVSPSVLKVRVKTQCGLGAPPPPFLNCPLRCSERKVVLPPVPSRLPRNRSHTKLKGISSEEKQMGFFQRDGWVEAIKPVCVKENFIPRADWTGPAQGKAMWLSLSSGHKHEDEAWRPGVRLYTPLHSDPSQNLTVPLITR